LNAGGTPHHQECRKAEQYVFNVLHDQEFLVIVSVTDRQ
jgi:hypothetical protein